jgi:hypothetical protein
VNDKALEAVGTSLSIGALTLCNVQLGSIGIDGGEPIDNTCLTNIAFVTKQPQALMEVPDFNFTCDYDPSELAAVVNEVNANQQLQLSFPSPYGTLTFWGYLKSLIPNEASRGEAWRANGVVVVTNLNGSAVETPPSWA